MEKTVNAILLFLAAIFLMNSCQQSSQTNRIDQYNVVWNKKSTIVSDAMPLGNGTTGALVSVTEDGHIWVSVRHVDAWSEAHRLLKPGDIEITVSPNPFTENFE